MSALKDEIREGNGYRFKFTGEFDKGWLVCKAVGGKRAGQFRAFLHPKFWKDLNVVKAGEQKAVAA